MLATCSSDRTVKIWTLNDENLFELSKTLSGHRGWVWDCEFSGDSKLLISVSTDPIVRIWKIESGEIGISLQGHTKGIVSLAFNDLPEAKAEEIDPTEKPKEE